MSKQDLTLNQIDNVPTRIQHAKQFLNENPTKHAITAARIYNLQPSTLYSALERAPTHARGGQNKILLEHQKEALHLFIRSLLAYRIQPTYQLVFNAICNLKRAQDPNFKTPSLRWFSTWWKQNGLHKIKAKPLLSYDLQHRKSRKLFSGLKHIRQQLRSIGLEGRTL